MTKLDRYLGVIALFCVSLLPGAAQADILVGIAGPLSGPNAAFGNELKTGATAAIAAINAQGGINGEQLALVEGDDSCDAKRALDVAKSFVSQDVRLVVGHFCSFASLAAAPTYASAGTLMITPSSTAPVLTTSKLWNVFRLAGREDMQADKAAARIKADGMGAEVLLVTDESPDLAVLVKRFQSAAPNARLVKIKLDPAKLPEDPALLTATAAYLALQADDGAAITAAIRTLNPAITLYGPDSLQSDTFGSKAGAAANGTHVTFPQDLVTIADPKRLATLPANEGSTLAAYAAVEIFAAAAKAKGVNNARNMAGWLAAGTEVATILGNISFTAAGDLKQQPYIWLRWQNGQLVGDEP